MFKRKSLIVILLSLVFFVAGCAGNRTTESVGEYLDDSLITTKVKALLTKDAVVKSFDISVETFRGIVILSGFVDEKGQINRAVSIAKSVKGVKEVRSNLVLKSK